MRSSLRVSPPLASDRRDTARTASPPARASSQYAGGSNSSLRPADIAAGTHHPVPRRAQRGHDIPADESGRSGNQNVHAAPFPRCAQRDSHGGAKGDGLQMTEFTLHEQLAADTIEVTRWPLSLVLLMNARQWPWLILVPRRPAMRELYELLQPDQQALMSEIVRASEKLAQLVRPDKINVAALGNAVPQLHVHVIGRFTRDPVWPKPVWGTVAPEPYPADDLELTLDRFRHLLTDR